jgi:hypothetical protein
MANGAVIQLAVFSTVVAVFLCLLVVYMMRKPRRAARAGRAGMEKPQDATLLPISREAEPRKPLPIAVETTVAQSSMSTLVREVAASPAAKPIVVAEPRQPAAKAVQEDRNQKILAGISENIRKNPVKPLPRFSPFDYSQAPRDTEYIRVKKKIITPHGHVRFSILKDTLSTNMLAVFRRASLDWKTADDLIGFIPSCLEPEAEILNGRLLLIGTPGHHEKLAIPIRSVDDHPIFRDCFELVTDVRPSRNTPAVIVVSDTEFDVVSKGELTQILFENPVNVDFAEVNRILGQASEGLQQTWGAAMGSS